MRVLLVAVGLVGFVVGCSSGADDSSLPRSQTPIPTRVPASSAGAKGGSDTGGSRSDATPAPAPAPAPEAPDASTPAPPPPATPVPGSCGAPKCFGLGGVGGCKAEGAAGNLVTMGCQDGACACFAGGQATTTFDGDVNSSDDARQLFLTNCTCN